MPAISVVIPVYNVEKYIERCARALFSQTMQDLEYIFIDDCTPDNSMTIVKQVLSEYPLRLSQVKVITHETNKGLAISRIDGEKEAVGKYIISCDSDDWPDRDLYEKLYLKAEEENADITICDFLCEYSSKKTAHKIETDIKRTPRDMLLNMPKVSFYCMVWRSLMRRDIIEKYQLYPLPHIDMWEDVCVTIPAFYHANKIAKISDSYYHYFINDTSMTALGFKPKSYEDRKATIDYLEQFFSDKKDADYSLLINYWKMLAKSFLLQSQKFDPIWWQKEYKEAHKDILEMEAFPATERYMYKITSYSTIPVRCCHVLKVIARKLLKR
jgi:glycosyltransferase involved in cell wall biosynthesis